MTADNYEPTNPLRLLRMEFGHPHTCRSCGERMPPGTVGYHDLAVRCYEEGFYCEFCAGALLAAATANPTGLRRHHDY